MHFVEEVSLEDEKAMLLSQKKDLEKRGLSLVD